MCVVELLAGFHPCVVPASTQDSLSSAPCSGDRNCRDDPPGVPGQRTATPAAPPFMAKISRLLKPTETSYLLEVALVRILIFTFSSAFARLISPRLMLWSTSTLQDRSWLWEQGFGVIPKNLGAEELVLVHGFRFCVKTRLLFLLVMSLMR